jgi:Ca2+/Na+ antiporter
MKKENNQNVRPFDQLNFDYFPCTREIFRNFINRNKIILSGAFLVVVFLIYSNNLYFSVLIFLLFFLYIIFNLERERRKLLKKFIDDNNLSYQESIKMEEVKGNLFKTGYPSRIKEVINGSYKEHRARLFYFTYTVQQGKNTIVYNFTVLEVFFDKVIFPYMHLLYGNRFGFLSNFPKHGKRESNKREVRLEDKFKNTFKLFVKDGYGIEAMQIFSKEFLDFLINEKCDFSIELNEDRMYIYKRHTVSKKEELKELFETANQAIKKIDPLLNRLGNDFSILRDAYSKKYDKK